MVIALIVVAAIINIIAKNNNYYIKTSSNPDFIIRVRRCASAECVIKNQIEFIKKHEDLLDKIENFEENRIAEVIENVKIEFQDEYINNKNGDDESALSVVREADVSNFKHILNLARKEISEKINDFDELNETLINKIDYALKRLILKLEKNNQEKKTTLSDILLKKHSKGSERYKRKATPDGYFTNLFHNLYGWFSTINSTDRPTEKFNSHSNNYSYENYNTQSKNIQDLRNQKYRYSPSYSQNYETTIGYNNYHNGYYYPVNKKTGLYDPTYNLGYSPSNYNNGYKNNQMNYKYSNDLKSSKNPSYNYNPTGYNHNATGNKLYGYTNNIADINELYANNTTTEETIIIEGCVLCGSFGCPWNYKRIGFKCVPK